MTGLKSGMDNFKLRLKRIKESEDINRKKAIFLDTTSIEVNFVPWKYLKREQKIEKIMIYVVLNEIKNVNRNNISNFILKNIDYEFNPGVIHSISFIPK